MAVISISITESPVQKVYGIPITVTLTANIPATIFYTLDGEDPTSQSDIVVGPITMPTNVNSVTLRYFATNGIITCPIMERVYRPNLTDDNLRRAQQKITGLNETCQDKSPLLGGGSTNGFPIYSGTAGDIVNNELIPGIPGAVDAAGNPTLFTDKPWNLENYEIIFDETNHIGLMGRGIGTLPGEVFVVNQDTDPPISSEANSPYFNPKAMVIIQDGTEEPYDPDHPLMLRPNFSTQDNNTRYGNNYFTPVHEGGYTTGSIMKPQYNSKNNTVTFYYRDRDSNKWIVSTEPFRPNPNVTNLSSMVFGRDKGVGLVFKWMPNYYRKLW